MDFLRSILEETVAGIVCFILGYFAGLIYTKFWKEPRSKTALGSLVLEFLGFDKNTIKGQKFLIVQGEEDSELISPYDTRATRRIASLLESANLKEWDNFTITTDKRLATQKRDTDMTNLEIWDDFSVTDEGRLVTQERDIDVRDPEISERNLRLVCGPKRNILMRKIQDMSHLPRYKITMDTKTNEYYIDDKLNRGRPGGWRSPYKEGLEEREDYGLIISMPSPLNSQRRVVILAGIHRTGTIGTGFFVSKADNLSRLCKSSEGGMIQGVILIKSIDRDTYEEIRPPRLVAYG